MAAPAEIAGAPTGRRPAGRRCGPPLARPLGRRVATLVAASLLALLLGGCMAAALVGGVVSGLAAGNTDAASTSRAGPNRFPTANPIDHGEAMAEAARQASAVADRSVEGSCRAALAARDEPPEAAGDRSGPANCGPRLVCLPGASRPTVLLLCADP